ncbi:MAG: hypothetical protein KTR31_35235 [Myxococcales bacterium]|nr:hypothetical protein [Myxococcales bacterium]
MPRQLRAVLLLIVVVANLVYAIPYPRIDEEDLEDPSWFQEEFQRWSTTLGQVGVAMPADVLQERVRSVGYGFKQLVMTLRLPFKPYFSAIRGSQQWGLFASVTQQPDTLVIEVRGDGDTWQELYRRLHPEHRWRDDVFKYRRLRGVWDGVRDEPKGTYKRFSVWVAKEVFRELPDVKRVRLYLDRRRARPPGSDEVFEAERRALRHHKRENHAPTSPKAKPDAAP